MPGLEEMIASLRSLDELPTRTAELAAPALERALKATAAAGTSPDGQAWAAKKTGGRAMTNAAKAISVKALGPVVRVTLDGPEVFHHFGKGSSEVRRPVIPDGGAGIPDVVGKVLEEASARAFDELTGSR